MNISTFFFEEPQYLHALKSAREKTGIGDCTIVTWDDESEIDGIRVVPAWKWLLA